MPTKILSAIQDDQFKQALKDVYMRSVTDSEFRRLALDDAKAAFEQVGFHSNQWKVSFAENDPSVDDVFFLPPAAETAEELSDAELEAVAGGLASRDEISGSDDDCAWTSCWISECIVTS